MRVRSLGYVVMAILVAGGGCSPAAHYRKYHDGESLCAVLHDSVRTGDSVEKVEGLLGAGEDAVDTGPVEAMRQFAARDPSHWTDGVKDDDRVIGFSINDGQVLWLQFRNGKLINHNPGDFTKYQPMINSVSGGG
jgi:hypothetical protein